VAYARQALALDSGRARTHLLLGMALARSGKLDEALASFDRAIALAPDLADAHGNRADVLAELQRHAEAVASYDEALRIAPDSAENWLNRGAALHDLKRYEEALASYARVVALQPDFAEVHINCGNILALLGRHQEAVAAYDSALASRPDQRDGLIFRADALRALRRPAEALLSYDRALALKGDHVPVLMGRGIVLIELARYEEALASYERVLALTPNHVDALNSRSFVLNALGRRDEALASCQKALRHDPSHVGAHINRGVVFSDLGRHEEAIRSYECVLAIDPKHAAAHCNRAKALFTLNRLKEALSSVDSALAIDPHHVEALFTRGNILLKLSQYREAIGCFERVLVMNPNHAHVTATLAQCYLTICDWQNTARIERELNDRVAAGTSVVSPFVLFGFPASPATLLKCARRFTEREIPRVTPMPPKRKSPHPGKIKLAYLSADFRRHPVSMLTAELFELHDRERFEVFGISLGADDRSAIRTRVVRAFDQFRDVAAKGDHEVARLLRDLDVDIVVDLGGYTDNARPGILARRPAAVQVSYIGFLGTMGADFIDYLIADDIVVPPGQEAFYSEHIVRVPDCFQVNDSKRAIATRVPSRNEAGLPEGAFVFCCFNGNYKITAPTFDAWMRLLRGIDGSVLWLFRSNDEALANLRGAAAACGIDPARLLFAGRASPEDHLARHALADLFLDTLPINAGATASDALWAGLPIVTLAGSTFLGRVSASLLRAVGLPDLVTYSSADYEALAFRLAADPALLKAVRQKLQDNRASYPLFNTDRFRRHIEAAYTTMWEIWQRGEKARSFTVDPI